MQSVHAVALAGYVNLGFDLSVVINPRLICVARELSLLLDMENFSANRVVAQRVWTDAPVAGGVNVFPCIPTLEHVLLPCSHIELPRTLPTFSVF